MTDSATLISVAATSLTVVAYILALWAYRRSGWGLLLPVLTGAATVVVVLVLVAPDAGVLTMVAEARLPLASYA